jgi:hypothetical protein
MKNYKFKFKMLQNIISSFTPKKNLELKIHQQTQNLILKNTNIW